MAQTSRPGHRKANRPWKEPVPHLAEPEAIITKMNFGLTDESKPKMKLHRPYAGAILALIFNQVQRKAAISRGITCRCAPIRHSGDEVNLRLLPKTLSPLNNQSRLSRLIGREQRNPCGERGRSRFMPISRLKYWRNPPIQNRRKTVSGDRKQPEGISGGRLSKGPPHSRDAV